MSALPFSQLYPLIRMHAKRVPQPAMDTAIRQAARQWCLESKYRQQSLPVNMGINTSWYTITPPNPDEEIIRIQQVQYNGQQWPVPLYSVAQADDSGQFPQQYPRRFFYEPPNFLVVLPLPQSSLAAGLSVRVVLQPTLTATTLDFTILQQHDRAIAHGALKFLLETNDSPWTNPKMAGVFGAEFEQGIASAASSRQTNFKPFNLLTRVHRY